MYCKRNWAKHVLGKQGPGTKNGAQFVTSEQIVLFAHLLKIFSSPLKYAKKPPLTHNFFDNSVQPSKENMKI